MTLKIFDLHLHRLASLSNIIHFSNVILFNSQTFELTSLHLLGLLFGTSNSISPDNCVEIGSVFFFKKLEKSFWDGGRLVDEKHSEVGYYHDFNRIIISVILKPGVCYLNSSVVS